MFWFFALLAGLTSLAISIAGLLAFIRNPKDSQNRWFFIVTASIATWIVANFFDSNVVNTWTQLALNFDFTLALFIAWSLFEFSGVLLARRIDINARFSPSAVRWPSLALNLLVVFIIFTTDLVVNSFINDGTLIVEYTSLFWLYAALALAYFVYALGTLLYRRRHVESREVRLLNIIFFGIFAALIANILSNIVFPEFIQDTNTVKGLNIIGYVGMLIFVLCIFIAITRQRLFDIRLVVARSLGYVFSLILLATFYGVILFGLARFVIKLELSLSAQVFLSLVTGLTALAFEPLHRAFDTFTKSVFYRDAYEPKELFEQLNKVLVSSLDVEFLMKQSVAIIENTIKADFALVGLKQGEEGQRLFALKKIEFPQKDINKVRTLTPKMRDNRVIVADYLEGQAHAELRELMLKNNVAVIVRLTQNTRSREDGLGYLVLGQKKSGNPYSSEDIQVLSTVGNELTIAIQNALHYEEIQQFNLELQSKVDEATHKLRRTNEKLKALDETKDDFISMASHQLRTPLTSVKGYLSMVLEEDAGKINATQHKMLGQAFTSSQRMVYLIADLLNVSRLRTGKFVIEATPTNLAVMIEEELAQLVESAKSRDLELSYNKPKDFPDIMLDETKTRQVVMNFIDNAIYYTPAGGHISVQLSADDKHVELRVVDDGIGVPKAEQHHLFTKFYRAGNARKARPDGTGLGLFMAKKVVIAQGGNVIFDSTEGKGSTFGFTFLRSKLAANPAATPVTPLKVAAPPKPTAKTSGKTPA
jgi:signal transduction histidine kinase